MHINYYFRVTITKVHKTHSLSITHSTMWNLSIITMHLLVIIDNKYREKLINTHLQYILANTCVCFVQVNKTYFIKQTPSFSSASPTLNTLWHFPYTLNTWHWLNLHSAWQDCRFSTFWDIPSILSNLQKALNIFLLLFRSTQSLAEGVTAPLRLRGVAYNQFSTSAVLLGNLSFLNLLQCSNCLSMF